MNPTIVLVHGAFAESSSWDGVIDRLLSAGHRVVAFANPLSSVPGDAAELTALVGSIDGPVVLAGHSYGGAVITNVPADAGEVVGLVFVAGFALEPGEGAGDAAALVPGSTLGETLHGVTLPGGAVHMRIAADRFPQQFCADLDAGVAARMAITQRPITERALSEPSGPTALWKTTPSWFVFGDEDHNIPVGAHRRMAERAGAVDTVELAGASHAVGVSRPDEVADVILAAARHAAPTAA